MTSPYEYGMWPIVIVNIAIFTFFVLSYLKPKGRFEWQSMGTFTGFLAALFTEMYGFPLTIYILTSVMGSRYPALQPFAHINGNALVALLGGSSLVSGLVMGLSGLIVLAGLVIIGVGWRQIHKANGQLVGQGLYSRVRHPQYASLFLIILGFMIQWPTFITLAMVPVLVFMYYRLARREEKEMENRFGAKYIAYRQQVPMLLPRFRSAQKVQLSNTKLSLS